MESRAGQREYVGPRWLPERRDPSAGRLEMTSVALSLAAILPLVYGLK
jgi:DHA2 family multidrug resistance protein-like MFS transporter